MKKFLASFLLSLKVGVSRSLSAEKSSELRWMRVGTSKPKRPPALPFVFMSLRRKAETFSFLQRSSKEENSMLFSLAHFSITAFSGTTIATTLA
jgi:hypothetical protein